MIRTVIVDDEAPARRKIRRLLSDDPHFEITGEASDVDEAVGVIDRNAPGLVFLDVEMPGGTGFDVLKRLRQRNFLLVFVTAHESFALDAFGVEAFDYLTKPVDPLRFERLLERVKQRGGAAVTAFEARAPRYASRLLVENQGRAFFVATERLHWIESRRNYLHLHEGERVHVLRSTLEEFARQLDPEHFVRINRSQIVNLNYVTEMRAWFHGEQIVCMRDGSELRWTRAFKARTSPV